MRSQTKLVVFFTAALLLVVSGPVSTFAANGWQKESGTWFSYDKNGKLETEKWEKFGDNWFYLKDDGRMAVDEIIESNGECYYVDENGSMVTNKWVSVQNVDYNGEDVEGPANYWYYFGSAGKAYHGSGSSVSFKTIKGKKYIFDEEGKMLYGWINASGQRENGDDAWRNGMYYCGDENNGMQSIGWIQLEITDNEWDDANREPGNSSENIYNDESQNRWFYFKGNGKKMADEDGKTINGKKYSFDKDGRMNVEWVNWDATPQIATVSSPNYARGFRYYGSPEDGARITKGWFQVVPDSYLKLKDYDDDKSNWYYADKDGKLVVLELKTISGKKYGFDKFGAMLQGVMFLKLGADNKSIVAIQKSDTSKVPDVVLPEAEESTDYTFDSPYSFKQNVSSWEASGYKLYCFDRDGSMQTVKKSISLDGDLFTFLFKKSGSNKGTGKTGIDNKKYYQSGMLMAATKEEKYAVIKITKDNHSISYIQFLTTSEFLDWIEAENDITNEKKYIEDYHVEQLVTQNKNIEYKLVDISGTIQKNKRKAKDGEGYCYEVSKNGTIVRVFVEN